MKIRLGLFVLAMMTVAAAPAFASYSEPAAGLQCSGNSIAIRFGRADNGGPAEFDPLPQGHEEPWKDTPFADNKRCTLANGDRVELHDGQGRAYPWGMGGADPDGFFSLWVNGRKVASREVYYHGYGSSEPRSNSLFLTGNTLERCRYTAGLFSTDKSEKVGCSSAPFHLATAPIDPLLPSEAEQARVGTFSIAATYSPSFCAAFVKRPEPGSEIKWESLELPVKAQPYFASGDYEPKSDDRSDFVNPHTMVDYFDLWNSSQPGTVVRFFGDWKFFMGDVLFFRYGRAPEEDIKAVRAKVQAPGGGTNYYQKLAADMGWMTLTEKPDVETSWQAFSLEGKTYLLEEPVYQSRSTLYRPRGQNQLEPVCVFQMIEDYF